MWKETGGGGGGIGREGAKGSRREPYCYLRNSFPVGSFSSVCNFGETATTERRVQMHYFGTNHCKPHIGITL